jgi:hypothetical protein
MCIAIFSDAGVGYPTKEIFERCWVINDDGAGWAYLTEDAEWHIVKGFMTFDAFWESWEEADFKPEHKVVVHLRQGTSGMKHPSKKKEGTQKAMCHPGCTHPFPVSDSKTDLFAEEITAKAIAMHNGIVGNGRGDLSDTQVSIADHLVPLLPYLEEDPAIEKLVTELLDAEGYSYSSRWWLANGRKIWLFGDWIHDEETKIWYSKDTYLSMVEWEQGETHPHWNTYQETERRTETFFMSEPQSQFLTKKLKVWSWAKWKKYEAGPCTAVSEHNTKKEETKHSVDRTIEVYNSDNEVIALIDGVTGESIWEKIPGKTQDVRKHCNDCGAEIKRSAAHGGLCPYCYGVVFPELDNFGTGQKAVLQCPNCFETNYIIDSTFDCGDTECCRCGALFNEKETGPNRIKGWNEDTKAARKEVIRDLLKEFDAK